MKIILIKILISAFNLLGYIKGAYTHFNATFMIKIILGLLSEVQIMKGYIKFVKGNFTWLITLKA